MTNPIINSHNGWNKLEEVWLGDVYPASWYDHLDPQVRDVFHKLTEITQEDLRTIEKTLQSFNITVRRPQYIKIEDFLLDNDQLVKPSITPRDDFAVIGNTLYTPLHPLPQWDHVLTEYRTDPNSKILPRFEHFINGSNIVRAGRDLVIDTDIFDWEYNNEFPDYRVYLVKNGGHMDGCFSALKPGLLLANKYFNEYDQTFPGWEIILLNNPTYGAAPSTGYQQPYPVYNGKFYNTTVGNNRMFNDHIIKHALDWVGDYRETYFELNCLSIDEKNVIMLAENEKVANDLEKHGITVHWVPFRTRSFWDGAMHCLTVDIRRQSSIVDYFPERG